MAGNISETMESLLEGMVGHVSTKMVLGEPVTSGDITVFPIADVSFGIAAGAFNKEHNDTGAGGIGAKVTPSALLVIQNGTSRIVHIRDTSSMEKIVNLVPDILNKITGVLEGRKE